LPVPASRVYFMQSHPLDNAPIEDIGEWRRGNRTLLFQLHPLLPEGIAWLGKSSGPKSSKDRQWVEEEAKLYPHVIKELLLDEEERKSAERCVSTYEELMHPDTDVDGSLRLLDLYVDMIPKSTDAYSPAKLYQALQQDGDLMEWLNITDPSPSWEEGLEIMHTVPPSAHPGFWSCITKYVLRGLHNKAADCLVHCGLETPEMRTLIGILRESNRDRIWRGRVVQASQSATTSLRTIYEILKGDKDAICAAAEGFFEIVVCLEHFSQTHSIEQALEIAREEEAIDETLGVEIICEAMLDQNLTRALLELSIIDIGVAAHLAAFATRLQSLEDFKSPETQLSLADTLLLSYIDLLLAQGNLGNIAVPYCKDFGPGKEYLREAISRVPPSKQNFNALVETCAEFGFVDQGAEITISWAHRQRSLGRYGEALRLYERATDHVSAGALVYDLFFAALLQGVLPRDRELLELLQSPQRSTPQLASIIDPLGKLSEYLVFCNQGNRVAASATLVRLIQIFNGVDIVLILWAQTLPLLATDLPYCMPLSDLYVLLAEIFDLGVPGDETYEHAVARLSKVMASHPRPAYLEGFKDPLEVLKEVRARLSDQVAAAYLRRSVE